MPDGSWGKSLALAFDEGEYVSAFAVIGESEQQYAKFSSIFEVCYSLLFPVQSLFMSATVNGLTLASADTRSASHVPLKLKPPLH
ncbi:putative metabolite transport protein [Trichinella spiralis]|uniref:Metabolite transport protein n=1 Tax=Trichinella spiralis TaxID=6334 RepID=A0ABR3KAB2_TRISP